MKLNERVKEQCKIRNRREGKWKRKIEKMIINN